MSNTSQESGDNVEQAGPGESATDDGALSEEDYALGQTSDPEGAEREEPAGEDYAGSGF